MLYVNHDDSEQVLPDRWDRVYGALAEQCRRRILGHLQQAGGRAPVDEVVTALSSDGQTSSGQDEDALRVQLYHVHLPRLDRVGLVEWNRDEATVALTDWAAHVPLFDPLPNGLVGTPLGRDSPSPEATDSNRPVEETGD